MSALPLNLIKGTRSAAYERLENTEDIEEVEQHIQTIKSKVSWYFIVIGEHKNTCLWTAFCCDLDFGKLIFDIEFLGNISLKNHIYILKRFVFCEM